MAQGCLQIFFSVIGMNIRSRNEAHYCFIPKTKMRMNIFMVRMKREQSIAGWLACRKQTCAKNEEYHKNVEKRGRITE